jgi:hypothetical protein
VRSEDQILSSDFNKLKGWMTKETVGRLQSII